MITRLAVLLVSLSLTLVASARLINAMYAVCNDFNQLEDVVPDDLRDFDYLYFMAAPDWASADYSQPLDSILHAVVSEHSYGAREATLRHLINTVHACGNRILCSFGGVNFDKYVADPAVRAKLAAVMAAFVDRYGYDGIDLDWEITITTPLHIAFMTDIRHALDALPGGESYRLTTAVNPKRGYTSEEARTLCDVTDWLNIMFYDMGGQLWAQKARHNAPLELMQQLTDSVWSTFPPDKLHAGLPSYGFYYEGIQPEEEVPADRTVGDYGRYFDAVELPALLEKGWIERWDEVSKCPYYFAPDGSAFVTLESHRSLDHKLDWIKDVGFGGVFWWQYVSDYVRPAVPGEKGEHLITDHMTEAIKAAR